MTGQTTGMMSGGIGFASRAVMQLLLFGVTIVATRSLSIADFGAYALATMFLILARALFYVGPYEFLLKARDETDLLRSCFVANVALAIAGSAILLAVHLAAPWFFASKDVGRLILALTPSIFLVAITAWYEAVLLRGVRVRRYYFSTLSGDIVGACVAIFLLLRGYGLASLVAQTYARLLVLLLMYVRATRERPTLVAPSGRVREVLSWSRSRYVSVLLNFTSTYGADFVLGITLSPTATGLYRASSRIVSTATDLFAQPLQKIAQTNLSARFKQQLDNSTAWLKMLSGVGAIGWAALAALALLADELVPLTLGEKWRPAVPIVMIFCLIKAFSLLDAVTTAFLVCHDRQRDMLRVQIGTAIAVLVLSFAAAPFGPTGVAAAVGCANVAMSVIYGTMVMRHSQAGRAAIADLLLTSAPPVAMVAAGILSLRYALPGLDGFEGAVAGVTVAGIALAAAGFVGRRRMAEAIDSLGHHQGGTGQTGK